MISKSDWKWFGNAGHFICAHLCQFHMTTEIGDFVVSTVGQMPETSPEESDNKDGDNWHLIGLDRFYETMVFRIDGHCEDESCGCGLPRIIPTELDFGGYMTAKEATEGHRELCLKWSTQSQQYAGQKEIDEEMARREKENECQSA